MYDRLVTQSIFRTKVNLPSKNKGRTEVQMLMMMVGMKEDKTIVPN